MPNPDLGLYVVHGGFWASFGATRLLLSHREGARGPEAATESTAPRSRLLLMLHMLAFGVMYFGMGNAILPNRVPEWFAGQRIAGTVLIAMGAALMCWALVYFRSWRFRAKIDAGHELATGGPFRLLRHPIYMGLNLLALGTALWVPTPFTWTAAGLMAVGSDLRGRGEEALLIAAFGQIYRDYCSRTRRFLPWIY